MEAREQDVVEILMDPDDPEYKIYIGSGILGKMKEDLISFLKRRKTTFAWKHEDMTGISKCFGLKSHKDYATKLFVNGE